MVAWQERELLREVPVRLPRAQEPAGRKPTCRQTHGGVGVKRRSVTDDHIRERTISKPKPMRLHTSAQVSYKLAVVSVWRYLSAEPSALYVATGVGCYPLSAALTVWQSALR